MVDLEKNFKNKKVLITGHTGFKGSWLTMWLLKLGANITGLSNGVPTKPSHYSYLNLKSKIKNKRVDLKNFNKIKRLIKSQRFDYIFHLAAQSLVKESYFNPKNTFETNTIGTLNILESLKSINYQCTVVLITSDKVYKNFEINRGYHENDILGGHDPYSASKASAEIVIQSYLKSFLYNRKNLRIGIARAGNVLGGGDWSNNRLIPDCMKSWSKNKTVILRSPNSTRPWQHVLEAIYGYLILAINLRIKPKINGEAFNFGPSNKKIRTVISVINVIKKNWTYVKFKKKKNTQNSQYESTLLKLNSNKAKKILKWKSILTFDESIVMITDWYKNFYNKRDKRKDLTYSQILTFEKLLKKRN